MSSSTPSDATNPMAVSSDIGEPTTRLVQLSPVVDAHVAPVRALVSEPLNAYRFRGLGPGSPERAVRAVLGDPLVLEQYLLADDAGRMLGLVQALTADFRHGTCQLGVVLSTAAQRTGWPLKGAVLFIERIFHQYAFRKLYLEVNEFNQAPLARGLDRMFTREGTLLEYEWLEGAYRDVTFWSITREQFRDLPLRRLMLRAEGRSAAERE